MSEFQDPSVSPEINAPMNKKSALELREVNIFYSDNYFPKSLF